LALIFYLKIKLFVDGDDLKADLVNIIGRLESEDSQLKFDWSENFYIEPPNDEKSITYRMWKKYIPLWNPM
jgi:hypothetical protein